MHAAPPWRTSLRAALPAWLCARGLVGLGWALAAGIADKKIVSPRPVQLHQGLFMWDGAFYRDLAQYGYHAARTESWRFFPLLPWLGRGLSWLPGLGVGPAVVLIANAAALVAGVLVHQLTWRETGDAATATRAAWVLALFPGAFTLVFAYAEGLLLALAAGSLLALRQRRWLLAAAPALLAGLTRPTGLFLAVPALIEAGRGFANDDRPGRLRRASAVAGAPLGVGLVLLHSRVVKGAWGTPLRTQTPLRGHTVFPLTRLARVIGDLAGDQRFNRGLHAPAAVGLIVAVALCARWLPVAYTALLAVGATVFLSADNLNSLERYSLNLIPIVLVAALLARRRRSLEMALFAVCGGVFVGLTAASLLGVYVP